MGDEQEQELGPDEALTGAAGPAPDGGLSPQGDDDAAANENRDPENDPNPEPAAPGEEGGADGAKEIVEAEAEDEEEPAEQPEPHPTNAGVVQDNVSEPGVQTTHTRQGSSSHGEPLEADEDETVDGEAGGEEDPEGEPSE